MSNRTISRIDNGHDRLLVRGLGAGRSSTMLAAIFVEIAGREHEEQPLSRRSRDPALWAVEQGCIERLELVRLFGRTRPEPWHLRGYACRPSSGGRFTRRSLHRGIVRGGLRDGQW